MPSSRFFVSFVVIGCGPEETSGPQIKLTSGVQEITAQLQRAIDP